MNTLGAISNLLASYKHFIRELNDKSIIEKILSSSIELTNADRGTIFFDPKYDSNESMRCLRSIFATGIKNNNIIINIHKGIAGHVYSTKESYICNDVKSDPFFFSGVDIQTGYKTQSILAVPLWFKDDNPIGVLQVLNNKDGGFSASDLKILELISIFAALALDNLNTLEQLRDSETQLEQRRQKWDKAIEGVILKSSNTELQETYSNLNTYAKSDSAILIQGESGTGKEVITKIVHHLSSRQKSPLVAINCAAIPESLFEAELFGVTKGAATGTVARKGKIEMAHRGTLFLDEIGEMPIDMQSKLLRVLQDKIVCRIGSDSESKEVDFRLVCATNKDLKELIAQGKFREDLFYRINVVNLKLPALRERIGDIKDISLGILDQLAVKRGWKKKILSTAAIEKLVEYNWPGNIRELQNRLENAHIVSRDSDTIQANHILLLQGERVRLGPTKNTPYIMDRTEGPGSDRLKLKEANAGLENLYTLPIREAKNIFEVKMVEHKIGLCEGNKTEAARQLGLTREGLRKILLRKRAA
jgi:Nif-specific regulatory protein